MKSLTGKFIDSPTTAHLRPILLLLGTLSLLPAKVLAHGAADNHLQVMVVDKYVKLSITVGMDVLGPLDLDRDGFVSFAELENGRTGFHQWFDRAVRIGDGTNRESARLFADITTDLNLANANGGRLDHARIVQTIGFAEAPDSLSIDASGLWHATEALRLTVIDAASGMKYRASSPLRALQIDLPH